MKKAILTALILFGLTILGCSKLPLPSNPSPVPALAPTATPTPNTTPTCGFTDLGQGMAWIAGTNQTYVIQNVAQWITVNGSGSLPSLTVNFSSQMVLEVSDMVYVNCGCSGVGPSITSVCFYSDHIEVDYKRAGMSCPTPPPGVILPICNSFFSYYMQNAVAVPQSSLPVNWISN